MTLRPIVTDGQVGRETLTVRTAATASGGAKVVLETTFPGGPRPGHLNLNLMPAVLRLVYQVNKVDPTWKPS